MLAVNNLELDTTIITDADKPLYVVFSCEGGIYIKDFEEFGLNYEITAIGICIHLPLRAKIILFVGMDIEKNKTIIEESPMVKRALFDSGGFWPGIY
jgi:hypothetical protein